MISPAICLFFFLAYFVLLIGIAYYTSKDDSNENFFTAKKSSPWYLVAFGMIGASLSGVTFISIPGVVGAGKGNQCFSYMQMVWGYLIGYAIIANVLMPIYYRYQVTSIYQYLGDRLGMTSYKTGAAFFLISRTIGAAFRMYIVALVLYQFIFIHFNIPFWITVLISIFLIWVYTYRGGIKTIVITDVFQTICMLAAVGLTLYYLAGRMNLGVVDFFQTVFSSEYGKIFFFEKGWSDSNYFYKQVFGGMLIALVMTGLDQDMMQKNLTCKTLKEAQLNMFSFSMLLFFVNLAFLSLGAALYLFAAQENIPMSTKSDELFPLIAFNYVSGAASILFLLGLTASNYASADSALASLTTSFCIDFLNYEKNDWSEETKRKNRTWVHFGFSILLFLVIVIFYIMNDDAVINKVFQFAGYTYGPLLGLFSFAILTKRKIRYALMVPLVCFISPVLCYLIAENSAAWFSGFTFGNTIVAVNGLITFIGLFCISKK